MFGLTGQTDNLVIFHNVAYSWPCCSFHIKMKNQIYCLNAVISVCFHVVKFGLDRTFFSFHHWALVMDRPHPSLYFAKEKLRGRGRRETIEIVRGRRERVRL